MTPQGWGRISGLVVGGVVGGVLGGGVGALPGAGVGSVAGEAIATEVDVASGGTRPRGGQQGNLLADITGQSAKSTQPMLPGLQGAGWRQVAYLWFDAQGTPTHVGFFLGAEWHQESLDGS